MTQGIAFFDFDDTLARGDSILPFLLYCIRKRIAPRRQLVKAAGAFLYWKLRPSRASRAKSATLSFLKGRSADEMFDVARAFFRDEYLPRFYQDGLTELWSLRSQGMKLVVVSASPDVYMRALPEFMPIDAVLSTRCEVGGDGRYTGQVGENCKGEEKVRRIEQYLKENGFVLDMKCSSAYGDSPSDADMMALVNRAVLVNPKKRFAPAAGRHCRPLDVIFLECVLAAWVSPLRRRVGGFPIAPGTPSARRFGNILSSEQYKTRF